MVRPRLCCPSCCFSGSLCLVCFLLLCFPHFLLLLTWRVCLDLQCAPSALTQEQVCGLCGNFDGIQNNDFTSSSLQVEEDPVDFGNSWKVSSQCADTRKVHLGSVWMEGPLILMGAVVAGTIGSVRAWN